jgi:aryl-alcohol dehydrogenase-like predicted oxidoreductase
MKNYRSVFFGARKLSFINHVKGVSSHNIALQFVLRQPGVSCAVTGTTNVVHLENNIKSISQKVPAEVFTRIQQSARIT